MEDVVARQLVGLHEDAEHVVRSRRVRSGLLGSSHARSHKIVGGAGGELGKAVHDLDGPRR